MSSTSGAPRWLLFAFQLPTHPSNARVKIWRRLRQIGAVPTRNSVYVLPNTDQCREDFEWIRAEIVAFSGEATVFAANALDGHEGDGLVAAFQRARDADYQALKRRVDRLASAWLIRRFIDPSATFAFVDHPAPSDVPFDMYVGEFSHQGPSCTFETLAQRFGLSAVAVKRIGQIVHDLDIKDGRYTPP